MTNDNGNTRTRPYSVLIADDAPAARDALRVLLEERGYLVTAAADGGEAPRPAREAGSRARP
jgi:CheY-like chemotaxis protein